MKKPTAFDVLERGVTGTAGGSGRVSATEQTRIRRSRKSRTYFQTVREAETLEKLRRCDDIIFDWEDWTTVGFAWWEKIAAAFEPPPIMTIDEWADRYRIIPPEFAAEPGLWSTRRAPYMRAVMQACSPSHDCRRVVLVKPTQSGGTEAAVLNPLGFSIHLAPRSILVIFPTLDLAESFSRWNAHRSHSSPRPFHSHAGESKRANSKAIRAAHVRRRDWDIGFQAVHGNCLPTSAGCPFRQSRLTERKGRSPCDRKRRSSALRQAWWDCSLHVWRAMRRRPHPMTKL